MSFSHAPLRSRFWGPVAGALLVIATTVGACAPSSSDMKGLLEQLCTEGEVWQADRDSGASTNQVSKDSIAFMSTLRRVKAIVDDTKLSAATREAWGPLDQIGKAFVWGVLLPGRECRRFQEAWNSTQGGSVPPATAPAVAGITDSR